MSDLYSTWLTVSQNVPHVVSGKSDKRHSKLGFSRYKPTNASTDRQTDGRLSARLSDLSKYDVTNSVVFAALSCRFDSFPVCVEIIHRFMASLFPTNAFLLHNATRLDRTTGVIGTERWFLYIRTEMMDQLYGEKNYYKMRGYWTGSRNRHCELQ